MEQKSLRNHFFSPPHARTSMPPMTAFFLLGSRRSIDSLTESHLPSPLLERIPGSHGSFALPSAAANVRNSWFAPAGCAPRGFVGDGSERNAEMAARPTSHPVPWGARPILRPLGGKARAPRPSGLGKGRLERGIAATEGIGYHGWGRWGVHPLELWIEVLQRLSLQDGNRRIPNHNPLSGFNLGPVAQW